MTPPPITIADYAPEWAAVYAELQAIYSLRLGSLARAIHHVGSTSVPGLAAKPIIDIDIVIDEKSQLNEVINRITSLGYIHRGNLGITDREAFGRISDFVPLVGGSERRWMKHNLYVCPHDSISLRNHLTFRDYLRFHPESAADYGALKRRLAEEYPHDIDRYIENKTPFIIHLLRLSGFDGGALETIIAENKAPSTIS
ncbi:MAG: GrpB family protein [Ignavibacteria bacterium]|nr:GrpB family protein [Ignavibacteria bacterium]